MCIVCCGVSVFGHGLKLSQSIAVAAQVLEGAAGGMITVHNVVAASAVVGLLGREGPLLRKTILPMTYYLLLIGSLTFIWIYGLDFNLDIVGLLVLIGILAALAIVSKNALGRRKPQRQRTPVYHAATPEVPSGRVL